MPPDIDTDQNIKKKRILIVDDIPINIKILGESLSKDYTVMVATNGFTALDILEQGPLPDLVLLDIMMPRMSGYEVCEKMKSNEYTADIPVVFITAMGDVLDQQKGFDLGAVDYIIKPFSTPLVKQRVKTQLALKQQRDHLQTLNTSLRELNGLKDKFLGTAAHDLRNPLSCIQGFNELLKDLLQDRLSSDEASILDMIDTSTVNMLKLVNDLLDVATIESGQFDLNLSHVNLSSLIEKRLRLMRYMAQKKGIDVKTKLSGIPSVFIDEVKIEQAFDNLFSNALKFSEPGTVCCITTGILDGYVYFSVKDEGPGIPKDEQCLLFGYFSKLSTRPTGDERSTGLGLSIVKKIVETHKGKIEVRSEITKGTEVIVYLPVETICAGVFDSQKGESNI